MKAPCSECEYDSKIAKGQLLDCKKQLAGAHLENLTWPGIINNRLTEANKARIVAVKVVVGLLGRFPDGAEAFLCLLPL